MLQIIARYQKNVMQVSPSHTQFSFVIVHNYRFSYASTERDSLEKLTFLE